MTFRAFKYFCCVVTNSHSSNVKETFSNDFYVTLTFSLSATTSYVLRIYLLTVRCFVYFSKLYFVLKTRLSLYLKNFYLRYEYT